MVCGARADRPPRRRTPGRGQEGTNVSCRTAVVDIAGLQDESIHLTSAFLIAGFPHVIGTLWQVQDDAAYEMADTFYRELRVRTASGLALPESARALRAAAVAARDSLQAPSLWAAHIHTGA